MEIDEKSREFLIFSARLSEVMRTSDERYNALVRRNRLRLVAKDGEIIAKAPPAPTPPPPPVVISEETKRHDYTKFVIRAAELGYKPGWAAYRYKDKYGEWPPAEFRSR
jgi:hypothetical protein